jgi:hypothetical protein
MELSKKEIKKIETRNGKERVGKISPLKNNRRITA